MTNAKKIRMALAYKEMSEAELARQFGSSPQAFFQRMKNGKFTLEEMEKIANILQASYVSFFEFQDGTKV